MTNITDQSKSESLNLKDEMNASLILLFLPLMMTLFFLQSIREFIGQIYFQNLGAMTLGPTVLMVFFLLSPIVVILIRKWPPFRLLGLTVSGILIFRCVMPFVTFVPSIYLVCTSLVVAFYGMYLPVAFSTRFRLISPTSVVSLFCIGFSLAIAADLTLRTIGTTWDISTGPFGIIVAPLLCIFTASILGYLFTISKEPLDEEIMPPSKISRSSAAVLGFGFGGIMFSILAFLAYPNVIARWASSSLVVSSTSVLLSVLIYSILVVNVTTEKILMRREIILIFNLLALITAIDLSYLLSPLASFLVGPTLFAFLLDLRLLWSHLGSNNGSLTDYALFHFTGMLLLLLFTLFYVLTLVAGLLLPALEGLTPYLILVSFLLAVIPPTILVFYKKEVSS